MLCALGLTAIQSYAQNATLRGTVKDASGAPMANVTVIAAGVKTVGVITDSAGRYSVDTDPLAVIEFTYLGYETQSFTVANRTQLDVTMNEERNFINDVVVIGYGTQKKANLTGAVASVTAEALEDRSTNSVAQMIQGAMPNVNVQVNTGSPGAGGTITVRGVGSINSSSPLILVDGIPGSIDQLNPNDIESISILKDASSAAIYGARAAFGVILVTTKKPEAGTAKITYSGYWAVSQTTTSTDFITNGYEWASLQDQSYFGRYGTNGANTYYNEEDYAELEARRYDKTENSDRPWVVEGSDGKYHYYGNFDWWDYLYKKNMASQSNNISISGGNDKIKYYLSASYYTKEGMMKNVDETYSQYTLNSRIEAQAKKWLKVTNTTKYFDKQHTYPGENAANAAFARTMLNLAPMYVPINPDGSWVGKTKASSGWSRGSWLAEGRLANIYQGNSEGSTGTHRFSNTFEMSATPVEGLSLNVDYTFAFVMEDNWKHQAQVWLSSGTPNADLVKLDNTMGKEDYTQKSLSFDPQHVFNAYANYEKSFDSGHSFTLTAGMNYEYQAYNDLLGYRSHMLSESLDDLNLATGGTSLDASGAINGTIKATGGSSAYELFGLFYRATYNYKNRYLLEANGRYDGSSRFMKGNRFGFFPSVSGAWRISEEEFMKSLNTFDNLKLRASYGILGNQLGVDMYPYSTISQKLTGYVVDGNLAYQLTSPAPVASDYTWEKVATFDVGLDVGMFGNRLNLSGDYFIRNTSDMFVDGVTLPAVYGADPPSQNAGEMRTVGYELTLAWNDKINIGGRRLTYSIFGSLGDSTSEITKYQGNDTGLITDYYVGKKIGEIWGYRVDGLFQSDEEAAAYTAIVDQSLVSADINASTGAWSTARGGDLKFVDQNGDKVISAGSLTLDDHGDLEIIGNASPRYNYGFGANLNYAGFDFAITFQGIGKYDLYPGRDMDKFWGTWSRRGTGFLPVGYADDAWSENNTDGYFPQIERGGAAYNGDKDNNIYSGGAQMRTVNDRYLQDVSYLRLKNLSFGYTLPLSLTKRIGVDKVRVYVSGDNLCYWSPFMTDYVDPELAIASSDGRVYPFSKTVTFGINLTF